MDKNHIKLILSYVDISNDLMYNKTTLEDMKLSLMELGRNAPKRDIRAELDMALNKIKEFEDSIKLQGKTLLEIKTALLGTHE